MPGIRFIHVRRLTFYHIVLDISFRPDPNSDPVLFIKLMRCATHFVDLVPILGSVHVSQLCGFQTCASHLIFNIIDSRDNRYYFAVISARLASLSFACFLTSNATKPVLFESIISS